MSRNTMNGAIAAVRFEDAWKSTAAQIVQVVLKQAATYAAEEFKIWIKNR